MTDVPSPTPPASPFELSPPLRDPFSRLSFSLVKRPLERLLHLRDLRRIHETAARGGGGRDFLGAVLDALGVRYDVTPEHLERVPREGPLIVVANHPYGAIEGIILTYLLRTVRPDAKVLANYMLHRIPELRESMIFVDPFGGEKSARFNIGPLRESIAWLKNGGALGIFPAGEVSTLDLKRRIVRDHAWQDMVARLVRITGAPVLPVFFEGSNGVLFQLAALIHHRLRTLLLPRACVKARGETVGVRIGEVIPFSKLEAFTGNPDMLGYLRLRTYMLSPDRRRKATEREASLHQRERNYQPVIDALDPGALRAELSDLPPEQLLSTSGDFEVWWATAEQAPNLLREIGRMREVTFRAVGEGTGKLIDLDRFDHYYLHLFLWNKSAQELVGAYRLGQTDMILPRFGLKGLYTSTLYKYSTRMASSIDCALEMGRSFVRPEYQRQHSPMALLWKGIGAFVVANPRYRVLFGPVSISSEYESTSRQMMIAFLKAHVHLPDLAKLAKPRHPISWQGRYEVQRSGRLVSDIGEVSSLVSGLESDQKGVPVLLRQYLRLNAKFLSCNVDPSFSGVWDGLMFTDLIQTDRRILDRHMGKDGAASFLEYHRNQARHVG